MKIERDRQSKATQEMTSYRASARAEDDVQIRYSVALDAKEVREALLAYIAENSELINAQEEGEKAVLVIRGTSYPDSTTVALEWVE